MPSRLSDAALRAALVTVKEQPPTPQRHGAIGDGVADDTAALTSFLVAGYREGYVPPGTYRTSQPLTHPAGMDVTLDWSAAIRATASMAILWGTSIGTDVQDMHLVGGIFDCNNLAGTGLRIPFGHRIWMSDFRILNSAAHALVLGDMTAAGATAQVFVDNFDITRGSSATPPAGSYGVHIARSTDTHLSVGNIVGAGAAGVRVDMGANYFTQLHTWGYLGRFSDISFDDNADENYWMNCMADTPNLQCFRIRQFRTYLQGCHSYINFQGPDGTVPGIYFDKTGADAVVVGHFFEGDNSTHRLRSDVECVDMTGSWLSYIGIVASRYQNVVTQRAPMSNFRPGAQFRSASGVGAATFSGDHADLLTAEKFSGVDAFRVNTSAATTMVQVPSGGEMRGYSDVYSTVRWRLDGATGGITPGKYATASRPSAVAAGVGAMIFDSTLNKPLWSDGQNWKDATGTTA